MELMNSHQNRRRRQGHRGGHKAKAERHMVVPFLIIQRITSTSMMTEVTAYPRRILPSGSENSRSTV